MLRATFRVCLSRRFPADRVRDAGENGRELGAQAVHRPHNGQCDQPRDQPVLNGRHAFVISQEALCELFRFYPRNLIYFVSLKLHQASSTVDATAPGLSFPGAWCCVSVAQFAAVLTKTDVLVQSVR